MFTFSGFLASNQRNTWLNFPHMDVYLRKAKQLCGDAGLQHCLDIANVSVELSYQNTGIFTKFLTEVEDSSLLPHYSCVRIENVLTDRFAGFFIKRGYTLLEGLTPSFFKQL